MNQSFTHSSNKTQRNLKLRPTLAGLAVAALMFGAFGAGAQAATPKTITLTAAQSGHVITVNQGTRIDVSLSDANWTFTSEGGRGVVKLQTWTNVPGSLSGGVKPCIPGTTCMPVMTLIHNYYYVAQTPGLTRLIARLTSCGSGTACTAAQSFWTVVIRVR